MDYVNRHFVSIRDLDGVDARINELNDERHRLETLLNTQHESQTDARAALAQEIASKIGSGDIDALIKEYGQLSVLVELRDKLTQKALLEQQVAHLEKAAKVESALNALQNWLASTQADLESIKSQIDDLQSPNLERQLTDKVLLFKDTLIARLASELDNIKWLSAETVSIHSSAFQSISALILQAVDLQALAPPTYPGVWWALEALLKPFAVRFSFHFIHASDLNKASRPEWALSYVEKFFEDHMAHLEMVVGPAFAKHNRMAKYELITAALVPVREKLSKMVVAFDDNIKECEAMDDASGVERGGRLLSHLIFETTSFDQRLRDSFHYNPHIANIKVPPTRKWLGLAGDILVDGPVDTWLRQEKRLARTQFSALVSTGNAFEVDHEYGHELRPSYSAYALRKLLENLTAHIKSISVAKFQLQYALGIHLILLDEYLEALLSAFSVFNRGFSQRITRLIKKDEADEAGGLHGVETLTGLFCLLKYMVQCMEQWSETLFFVQLWSFYQTLKDTKEESLFGSTTKEYTVLLKRVFAKYDELFRKEVRLALREYTGTDWQRDAPETLLAALVLVIMSYMLYLRRSLSPSDCFLVANSAVNAIALVFWEYVVTNSRFNAAGLRRLESDIAHLEQELGECLWMRGHRLLTLLNRQWGRVKQLVELMKRFDASTAKVLRGQFDHGVREQFDSRLSLLSDEECRDALYRVV